MTIKECLDYVDEIKPNAFSDETKTVWLNEAEGMVQTEILLRDVTDCFQLYITAQATTGITIPDDHTIGIADKLILRKFRPGGKLTDFAPGGVYENDAAEVLTIQDVTEDGLVFAENTFSATGTDVVSTTLKYDGSNVEMLTPNPHSKIYPEYIIARIDYANGEYDKYDNTMQMFNAFWGEFSRWYARERRPADRRKPAREAPLIRKD